MKTYLGIKKTGSCHREEGQKKYFQILLADGKDLLTFATLFGRNGRKNRKSKVD
jgi:hypothetical protein